MKHENPVFLQVDQRWIPRGCCFREDTGAVQALMSFHFFFLFVYESAHFKLVSVFTPFNQRAPIKTLQTGKTGLLISLKFKTMPTNTHIKIKNDAADEL